MKNKIKKISLFALILIVLMQIAVFADTLTLNITTDRQEIKKQDQFKITVSWEQGMQAADFYLKYDSEIVEFIKADISEDYINSEEGQVRTAWFSMDDTDKTQIEYTFKAKKAGKVEFKTKTNGGFATGELEIPENYEEGKLTLEIQKQPLIIRILKVVLIVAVILIIIRMVANRIKTKKVSKKRKG